MRRRCDDRAEREHARADHALRSAAIACRVTAARRRWSPLRLPQCAARSGSNADENLDAIGTGYRTGLASDM